MTATHMDWHIEIIRFKIICHLAEALKCIFSYSLLKSKGFSRFVTFLGGEKDIQGRLIETEKESIKTLTYEEI